MPNNISRSLIKLILPTIYKILIKFKLNRRVINFLSDRSYGSNDQHDFTSLISDLLKNEKIISPNQILNKEQPMIQKHNI